MYVIRVHAPLDDLYDQIVGPFLTKEDCEKCLTNIKRRFRDFPGYLISDPSPWDELDDDNIVTVIEMRSSPTSSPAATIFVHQVIPPSHWEA